MEDLKLSKFCSHGADTHWHEHRTNQLWFILTVHLLVLPQCHLSLYKTANQILSWQNKTTMSGWKFKFKPSSMDIPRHSGSLKQLFSRCWKQSNTQTWLSSWKIWPPFVKKTEDAVSIKSTTYWRFSASNLPWTIIWVMFLRCPANQTG